MMTFTLASMFLVLTFVTVCVAVPSEEAFCKIVEESKTRADGKLIKVACGDKSVLIDLVEGGTYSTLRVTGQKDRNLLTVDYFKSTHDLFIVIDGQQFNVKDEASKAEEGQKFLDLLNDPEFEFFPEAVRLIHDELQLKGWESPAVMFLYRIAIAAENYHHQLKKRTGLAINKRAKIAVDPDTYKYHGPNPELKCTFNGWSDPSMKNLISEECRGVCGQVCSKCWKWVCNDCCMHTGCKRHDDFCSKGYFTGDCLTCRGVLWDTITEVPLDC